MTMQLALPIPSPVGTAAWGLSKLWLTSPEDEDLDSVHRLVSGKPTSFEYAFIDALSGGNLIGPSDFVLIRCSKDPLRFSLLAPQLFAESDTIEGSRSRFLTHLMKANLFRPHTKKTAELLMLGFSPGARRSSFTTDFLSDIEYLLHLLRRVDVFDDPDITWSILEDVRRSLGDTASPTLLALLKRCWAESLASAIAKSEEPSCTVDEVISELYGAFLDFRKAGHLRAGKTTLRHRSMFAKYSRSAQQLKFPFAPDSQHFGHTPSFTSNFHFKRIYGVSSQFSDPIIFSNDQNPPKSSEKVYLGCLELSHPQMLNMLAGMTTPNLRLSAVARKEESSPHRCVLTSVLDQSLPVLLGLQGRIGAQSDEILMRPVSTQIRSFPECQIVKTGEEAKFSIDLHRPDIQLIRMEAITNSGIRHCVNVKINN